MDKGMEYLKVFENVGSGKPGVSLMLKDIIPAKKTETSFQEYARTCNFSEDEEQDDGVGIKNSFEGYEIAQVSPYQWFDGI